MNILSQGEERFQVSRFIEETASYWKAEINFFDDELVNHIRLHPLYTEVAAAYKKAFELGVQVSAVRSSEFQLPESPVDLSFMISYVLDIPAEEKQKLLEMKSTELRLEALLIHLDEAIRKLEQQVAYKSVVKKVRGNGDLGHPGGTQA